MSDTVNVLAQIRHEKGMTQDELAEASGVSKRFIQDIEYSLVMPSIRIVVQLARALDVSLLELEALAGLTEARP